MPLSWFRRFAVALLLCAGLVATTSVVAPASAQAAVDCSAPIHFFGLRGSGEIPKDSMGKPVTETFNKFRTQMKHVGKEVSKEAIPYSAPAVWPPSVSAYANMLPSVKEGVKLLSKSFKNHADACKKQVFMIGAYSKGAWVANEFLNSLSAKSLKRINGLVLYGDAEFQPSDGHATGSFNASLGGIRARKFLPLKVTARSYCFAGDPVCNYSATNLSKCIDSANNCPHLKYGKVTTEAADYLSQTITDNIVFERVWSRTPARKDKSSFTCGEGINYAWRVKNKFGRAVKITINFRVFGPRELYNYTRTVSLPAKTTTFALDGTLPPNTRGTFTIKGSLDYQEGNVTKSGKFTVTC